MDPCLYVLAVSSVDIEDAFDEVWKTPYPRRKLPESMGGNFDEVSCQAIKPNKLPLDGFSLFWINRIGKLMGS